MAKNKGRKGQVTNWGSSPNMWRSPSTIRGGSGGGGNSSGGICGLIVLGGIVAVAVVTTASVTLIV